MNRIFLGLFPVPYSDLTKMSVLPWRGERWISSGSPKVRRKGLRGVPKWKKVLWGVYTIVFIGVWFCINVAKPSSPFTAPHLHKMNNSSFQNWSISSVLTLHQRRKWMNSPLSTAFFGNILSMLKCIQYIPNHYWFSNLLNVEFFQTGICLLLITVKKWRNLHGFNNFMIKIFSDKYLGVPNTDEIALKQTVRWDILFWPTFYWFTIPNCAHYWKMCADKTPFYVENWSQGR